MYGVLFVVLASVIYGVEPTIRQLIINGGISPTESIFIGFVFSTIYVVVVCRIRKKPFLLKRAEAVPLLLAGVIGTGLCALLLILSYQYIPVGCATVIHFLYPTIVCLAMRVFFKKQLTFVHILAILFSIIGLLCISTDLFATSLTGILLAAISSFAYAFYIVLMGNNKSIADLPIETKTLYNCLGGLLVAGVAFVFAEPSHAVTLEACVATGGCVLFGTAAIFLFLAGLNRIGSTTAAFLSLLEPITSVLVSSMIFHDQFSLIMALGCVLELAAILLISMGDRLVIKNANAIKG